MNVVLLLPDKQTQVEQMSRFNAFHFLSKQVEKRLEEAAQRPQSVLHGGLQVYVALLKVVLDVVCDGLHLVLDVVHLGLQQVIQGVDLGLGVFSHLNKVRLEAHLHLLHAVRGFGLKLLQVRSHMSATGDTGAPQEKIYHQNKSRIKQLNLTFQT